LKVISILGSTGSIGKSTLEIVRLHMDSFKIFALSCDTNINLLLKQAIEFKPSYLVCSSKNDAIQLRKMLPLNSPSKVLYSSESNNFIAEHENVTHVVAAISGSAGLESTFHAAMSGKTILLANKESMVMAGPLFKKLIEQGISTVIPIDSEHNAIFQILNTSAQNSKNFKSIILTASGGPFLNTSFDDLKKVTVDDALNHPNWSMGKKVTIDSATMMNKGLEIIEAAYLFNLSNDQIKVLIHPQSIIHSLVEYYDGSLLTQLGIPDMRIPISYALGFPDRIISGLSGIDLTKKNLQFLEPDLKKFPCLNLAYNAIDSGHSYCVALNASNEIAVDAFLKKKIPFTDIYKINYEAMQSLNIAKLNKLSDVLNYDLHIRKAISSKIKN